MAIQQKDDTADTLPAAQPAQGLRIIVCGASGTGTSTLLGRLADTVAELGATSRVRLELADLTDDEAGVHEIAAGGWSRELSILLTDADRGFDLSTKRRVCLLSLLGVRKLVLAVNKADADAFSQDRFDAIAREVASFQTPLDFEEVVCIPVSSLSGDNLVERTGTAPWYRGTTLLECLQDVLGAYQPAPQPFRLRVDNVVASDGGAAGCAGSIVSGELRTGDDVAVLPGGKTTQVTAIRLGKTKADAALSGDAVVLSLADGVGLAPGDVLASADAPADVSDQVAAHIVWTGREPMLPSRNYLMTIGAQTTAATITTLKYKINVENLDHIAGPTLERGEIAYCNLSMNEPVVFDAHKDNQRTGSFLLVDKLTGETVGAGMIAFGLRRATNIRWQALDIDKTARAGQKQQKPCVLWFTGLSGSGKSTLANLLEKRLHASGRHTYVLDGDNVRHGLNKDLGFTDADRVENIRRVAETAKLMVDAGLIVMASFISPFRSERRMARELFGDGEFMEIFVDTPLDICEQRDPKGLYGKARAGLIKNFTGIDSDYEVPEQADMTLDAGQGDPEQLVDDLIGLLEARNII